MKKFALAGNPNSGKTTLFNILTGSTAHVGNWPGVTVDKREGVYKCADESVVLVDLPGIYSLSPYTSEEVISRNFILDEKPDCVINVVDATNIERNLYLTTQLLEIDVPIVVALNMIDEVENNGGKIYVEKLEKKLGLPVVAISALKGSGIEKLMTRAIEASKKRRQATTVLKDSPLGHLIADVSIALEAQNVENPLFHAVKLVELDEIEVLMHKSSVKMVEEFKRTNTDKGLNLDFEAVVADNRYKHVTKHYSPTVQKAKKSQENEIVSKSDKIDRVLTHKIWAIPMFLLIMFAVFHITFSENFLFLAPLLDGWLPFEGTAFEGVFADGALFSPGVILLNLMTAFTDWIISLVANLLGGSPEWVLGLICDGVLGGISSVLSFVPQVLMLLSFISIMEDSGYMARVAFILDRLFKKFGLSGRALIPMIMGFGCSVPAMVNTRTLSSEQERIATIRVIPFFSCGAKLPILTAVAGAIVSKFGVGNPDVITYSMYLLGMAVAIVSIITMKATVMNDDDAPFIMELPAYRAPSIKNLAIHLWSKAKHFLEKAFTIIFASTIVIWVVSHFTFDWRFLADEQMNDSILAGLGKLLMPIFTPLGFGSQLTEWGWVFIVAAITGLIAKENVIATFGTLAACIGTVVVSGGEEGVGEVVSMITATGITIPALISFIAFNMLTIPCFATVATAKAELPEKKFKTTLLFWFVVSFIASSVIYVVGSWWWTVFIVLAVAVALGFVLKAINKRRAKQQ